TPAHEATSTPKAGRGTLFCCKPPPVEPADPGPDTYNTSREPVCHHILLLYCGSPLACCLVHFDPDSGRVSRPRTSLIRLAGCPPKEGCRRASKHGALDGADLQGHCSVACSGAAIIYFPVQATVTPWKISLPSIANHVLWLIDFRAQHRTTSPARDC